MQYVWLVSLYTSLEMSIREQLYISWCMSKELQVEDYYIKRHGHLRIHDFFDSKYAGKDLTGVLLLVIVPILERIQWLKK